MPGKYQYILDRRFSPPRNWKAKWIWANDDGCINNSYYYFRKEFSLEDLSQNYQLYITAETRYRLYINGKLVGQGPPPSQPFFKYYDIYDVISYLIKGLNCIGVVVNYVGNTKDTRGGLLAELIDNKGESIMVTDTSWRVRRSYAWRSDAFFFRMNFVTPYQEFYDARQVPQGWNIAGFNDTDWEYAAILKGCTSDNPPSVLPWSYLVPRDIPFMYQTSVLPVRIEAIGENLDLANRVRSEDLSICLSACGGPVKYTTVEEADNLLSENGATIIQNSTLHFDHIFDGIYNPYIVLDFGRVITAFIELELEGIEGGIVDIGYAERLIDGHFNNAIEGQFADRYVMTDGKQTFRSFTWKGFRYIKLLFHSCFKKVTLHSVKAIINTYPYEEKGVFNSSDPVLNKVFDISRYTLRLCSNEFIMDTPWREQGQWLGDVSAVTLGGIYACFGDTLLPAKFLRQSANNQLPTGLLTNVTNTVSFDWQHVLCDYSLWWIMALWNHHMYTGEEDWIYCYYPYVLKIINAFIRYIDEYGLVANIPYPIFIDWADVDRRGECAILNALLYGTLEVVEKMAHFKQDIYTLELIKDVKKGIKANFMLRFYDQTNQCFVDANIDGVLSPKISEHTNAAAILWDLSDVNTTLKIIASFYENKSINYTEAQPFFTTVVLQALDKSGRFDLALEIIRERWGKRMVSRGATSTYEEWGINGSWRSGQYTRFLRSLSHAWSAHPAEFLIKNLIGLEILEAGCRKVRLQPKKTSFDYLVNYPTPLGIIRVSKEGDFIDTAVPDSINVV